MKPTLIATMFALFVTACAMDEATTDEAAADDELGEIQSDITAYKNNVVARHDGLCLWQGGYCLKMAECDVVYVESVDWNTGWATVKHYATGWRGRADKNYLTAGKYEYGTPGVSGYRWCQAGN